MDKDSHKSDKYSHFIQLIFNNDRRIYAYIYVLVPNSADADDIFQDTVTVMWEKFDRYEAGTDFGAWGVGIAYNLVRNYRRKKSRSRLRFKEDLEELIQSEAKEPLSQLDYRIDALQKCLTQLDQGDREAVMLKYRHNYTTKTISDKIGYSIKVVYTKLSRANDFLLRCVRRTIAEQNI